MAGKEYVLDRSSLVKASEGEAVCCRQEDA